MDKQNIFVRVFNRLPGRIDKAKTGKTDAVFTAHNAQGKKAVRKGEEGEHSLKYLLKSEGFSPQAIKQFLDGE